MFGRSPHVYALLFLNPDTAPNLTLFPNPDTAPNLTLFPNPNTAPNRLQLSEPREKPCENSDSPFPYKSMNTPRTCCSLLLFLLMLYFLFEYALIVSIRRD